MALHSPGSPGDCFAAAAASIGGCRSAWHVGKITYYRRTGANSCLVEVDFAGSGLSTVTLKRADFVCPDGERVFHLRRRRASNKCAVASRLGRREHEQRQPAGTLCTVGRPGFHWPGCLPGLVTRMQLPLCFFFFLSFLLCFLSSSIDCAPPLLTIARGASSREWKVCYYV